MEIGTLFRYNKHVLEVCQAKENACSGCIGLTRQASCKKLPFCIKGKYFRRLSPFEVRRAIKNKTEILDSYKR
ncbi:hypothetical protein [Dysgonomonas sp. 520]|uniref:hypothetical protein n=1 Tax=Dysgonomonas sp. 520 TaxID=2302931 RepID=UPI0013CF87D1|nr:hypothetical protein [Dysgonomonas sp. 520]NDW08758.1 hypothetical protein [Dysgonomonas sp. 520]